MLSSGLEHNLVDDPVERIVREVGELFHPGKVIVLLFRPRAESLEVILRILEGQDACAARVKPVSGLLSSVSPGQPGRDRRRRTHMIRSVCGVQHDVGVGSLLFQQTRRVEIPQHDPHRWVRFLHLVGLGLAPHQDAVVVVWMSLVYDFESVAGDVPSHAGSLGRMSVKIRLLWWKSQPVLW